MKSWEIKFFSSIFRFNIEPEKTENVENNQCSSHRRSCRRNEESDDLDFDIDLDDTEEDNQMGWYNYIKRQFGSMKFWTTLRV